MINIGDRIRIVFGTHEAEYTLVVKEDGLWWVRNVKTGKVIGINPLSPRIHYIVKWDEERE